MNTRLAVLAVSVGIVLVSGPGVAAVDMDIPIESDGTIELAPHPGPNGEYVTIEDGEPVVRFDRLVVDTVTRADDVFTITAADDRPLEVRIEHDADAVAFYRDGDPDKRIDDGERVTLEPGERIDVGITVDTREPKTDLESIVIDTETHDESDDSADVQVASLSVADKRLAAGETTTITAEVENVGSKSGEASIELTVDGIDVDWRSVFFEDEESREVTFDRTFQQTGEFTVQVDSHRKTVVVEEPDETTAVFAVTDVSVEPTSVEPGAPVTVTAVVENHGDADGTFTAELATGGVVRSTATVFVPAGETNTVTFERTFETDGTRPIAVSGTSGDDLRVESASSLDVRVIPSRTQAIGVSVAALVIVLFWRQHLGERLSSLARSKL